MTVLVTGANGQLGCWLRLAAAGSPNSHPGLDPGSHFLFSDISPLSPESREMLQKLGGEGVDMTTVRLDVTDLAAVREMVKNEGVEAIVNCAAFTNVDAAESQPEAVHLLNIQAPENLALTMREVNGLLIHLSTDYIFGGTPCESPIPEDFPAAPLGAYGRSKWEGEEAIRKVGCRHVILRTAWLFSEFGRNFVRTMLRLIAERPQIKVVDDQRGTPTYAADLARTILQILSKTVGHQDSHPGLDPGSLTLNYTNAGECTWYEFACEILRQAQDDRHKALDDRVCEILPCRSEEFPSPVRRPAYSVLDKSKIRAALGLAIPDWRDGLRRCLASLL